MKKFPIVSLTVAGIVGAVGLLQGCDRKGEKSGESSIAGSVASEDSDLGDKDSFTGVSNDKRIYPVDSVATTAEEFIASSSGSGELLKEALEAEGAAEFERLLALPVLTADGPLRNVPESIIDGDDRRKVADTTTYPQRAQVLIALPGGRCSGALIGKDLVLTAGHCVHSGGKEGNWYASATVYPGRSGATIPFGSCSARRLYSVKGWTEKKNSSYDFGAIKLNCTIGDRVGWLGIYTTNRPQTGVAATVSSYPGDKPLEQWAHTGSIKRSTTLTNSYDTDTMPGNSGSGVFATTGVPIGCAGPCAHTAHAYGGSLNSGTKLTKPLFDNLNKWRNEAR
jgi:glutamyl endopeptidase